MNPIFFSVVRLARANDFFTEKPNLFFFLEGGVVDERTEVRAQNNCPFNFFELRGWGH